MTRASWQSTVLLLPALVFVTGCVKNRDASLLPVQHQGEMRQLRMDVTLGAFGFSTEGPILEHYKFGGIYLKSEKSEYDISDVVSPVMLCDQGKFRLKAMHVSISEKKIFVKLEALNSADDQKASFFTGTYNYDRSPALAEDVPKDIDE